MIDKRFVAAGFAAGVLLGVVAMNLSRAADSTPTYIEPENEVAPLATETDSQEASLAGDATSEQTADAAAADFESFVRSYAAANGGRISLRELNALAEIYANRRGLFVAPDEMLGGIRHYPVIEPPAPVMGVGAIPMPSIDPGRRIGALGSLDDAYGGSASRRYMETNPSLSVQRLVPPPVILNPAGPGTYTSTTGDVYTQAGPHGVVNTETGEFSPHP